MLFQHDPPMVRPFVQLKHAEDAAEAVAQDLGITMPIVREGRPGPFVARLMSDLDPPDGRT